MNRSIFRFLTSGLALTLLSPALLASSAGGQELPWLPPGKVRLDFAPTFWTWDSRYGLGPDLKKKVEALSMDLAGDPFGSDLMPGLLDLESSLAEALDQPSYRVDLGVSQAYLEQSRLVFPFRLELGVTDWLTIGGMVPLVRSRMEMTFALDADSLTATDGPSPFLSDATSVINFLDQIRSTLLSAEQTHPGEQAVADAGAYLNALILAYSHGTFFPVTGSAAGTRLQERLEELTASLEALGITGMPTTVPLAQEYLNEEGFQEFLADPYMGALPLEDFTSLWSLGDVEITANVRLLHGGFEPDSLGNLPSVRYQLGAGALVRLGTGDQEDPARFFDQDAGDGQMDLEGNVFGLVELGSRLGAWGQVRYGIQNEGAVFRRITPASHPLPEFGRTAPLKWTPGDYLEVDLNPRFFLTPALSFGARFHLWKKGEDSYVLGDVDPEIQDPATLPPADLLNLETEQKLQEMGFSATYSTVEAHARGEVGMPLYIRATYFHPVSGSGGQVPKGGRFQAGISIYKNLWGGAASAPEELPSVVSGGR